MPVFYDGLKSEVEVPVRVRGILAVITFDLEAV
jgi:hypothetical protein